MCQAIRSCARCPGRSVTTGHPAGFAALSTCHCADVVLIVTARDFPVPSRNWTPGLPWMEQVVAERFVTTIDPTREPAAPCRFSVPVRSLPVHARGPVGEELAEGAGEIVGVGEWPGWSALDPVSAWTPV